jgi:hypothetical protein
VLGQSVSLLENDQSACSTLGHLEDGSFNLGEVNCPRFIWSAQKQPDRIGLNQDLADFVSENHYDDQHSNSTDTLEKPAGKHEPAGLSDGVTQPKKKNAQQDLQGCGSTKEKKQPVNKKADYQDIYHILPLEGKKEVHKSYSSTPSPTQGLDAGEYVASIAPQIVLAKFILGRRLWFLELRLVSCRWIIRIS